MNAPRRLLLSLVTLSLPTISSAQANFIVNPSFEYYSVSSPGNTAIYTTTTFVAYTLGASAVGNDVPFGWEHYSGNQQVIIYSNYGAGAFPTALAGSVAGGTTGNDQLTQNTTHPNSYFVYLGDSAQASTIRQTGLALTAGTTYTLAFQLAPLIFGGAPDAKVDVQIISASQTLSPATFTATSGGGWQTQTYTFTAGFTESYSVYFASTTGNNTVMDNVSLTAVPEPSAYAALFGVCALGVVAWCRRRNAAA